MGTHILRPAESWGLVFVGAVVVRLTYWRTITPHWVPMADADQYVQLSRSLANGEGFSLVFPEMELHATAFRPPLYPLLLTPASWLFGNALWPARLLSVLLGSLVVVLAGVLATRIAGRRAGLCTAAVVALYPPLLANDSVALTEPLALGLLLSAILLIDDRRWLAGGLVTGLVLLTRPNGYLAVAMFAAWCWRRIGPKPAAGLVLAALVVSAPWLVRNQIQVGTWRPTTSDGFTMAAIYARPAQAEGHFVDPVFSPAYDDPRHRSAQFDEPTWNRVLTEDAIAGVKHNPRYVGHTIQQNLHSYFELNPSLNTNPEVNDGRNLDFGNAMRPVFYLVTVVGLLGLAMYRRDPRVVILAAITAQFVVLSLLLVAPPRLRAPFDLACCVGAGLLLAAAGERWARGRGRRAEALDRSPSPVGAE